MTSPTTAAKETKELQTLFCYLFSKFELPNRGCGLSTGAAYTQNFTVVFLLIFIHSLSFSFEYLIAHSNIQLLVTSA